MYVSNRPGESGLNMEVASSYGEVKSEWCGLLGHGQKASIEWLYYRMILYHIKEIDNYVITLLK